MDAKELNAKIAEIKGYVNVKERWNHPTGIIIGKESWGFMPIPDWAGDLNSAMKLVQDAEKIEVGFNLSNTQIISSWKSENVGRISYHAAFYDPWGGPKYDLYDSENDDPAFAVAEAWVKMMEARK